MLNVMRKHLKKLNWILWIVILSFVMTIFLVWGMDADDRPMRRNYVALVNGDEISLERYNEARRSINENYRSMFGDRFEEIADRIDIDGQALSSLVEGALVRQEAQRLGIEVSDSAVQAEIASIPAFHQAGRFSQETYRTRLEAMRRRPGDFEEAIRQDIRSQRVRSAVQGIAQISEQEVLDQYKLRNDQISVDALVLVEKDFEKDAVPTAEQKKAYYEEHKTEFQVPETVQAEYVLADRNKLMEKIVPSPQDIAAYYEKNKETRFRQGEGVHARHILFDLEESASEDQKQAVLAKAQAVYDEILRGRDFTEAATALTEDTSTKDNGGDLGWFERGSMVAEFEEKAFSLKTGEVSPPVLTQFGYHVIRLEAKREAGYQPLAEAEAQIKTVLQHEQANETARKAAEAARAALQAGKSTEEAALAAGLESAKTGFFGVTDEIGELIRDPALNRAVFALQVGNVSEVLSSARGFFVFKLTERRPPHQGTIEEVDQKLVDVLRTQKAAELAKARADLIKTELASASLGQLAKKYAVDLKATPELRRNGSVQGAGRLPPEAEAALYSAEPASVIGPVKVAEGHAFVRVIAKKPADLAELEKTRKQLEQELLDQKQNQVYQAWLAQLQAKADIKVMEQRLPGSRATQDDLSY